jgi:hypothetical protein
MSLFLPKILCVYVCVCVCVCVCVYIHDMGFELRALHLLGKLSTTSATPQPLFLVLIFQLGSQIFALAGLRL